MAYGARARYSTFRAEQGVQGGQPEPLAGLQRRSIRSDCSLTANIRDSAITAEPVTRHSLEEQQLLKERDCTVRTAWLPVKHKYY